MMQPNKNERYVYWVIFHIFWEQLLASVTEKQNPRKTHETESCRPAALLKMKSRAGILKEFH